MKLEFDPAVLTPLIEETVQKTIERMEEDRAKLNGRLAHTGPEAAALLGVQPHVLKDARLRGEIIGTKIGKKICYERSELLKFLERNRCK